MNLPAVGSFRGLRNLPSVGFKVLPNSRILPSVGPCTGFARASSIDARPERTHSRFRRATFLPESSTLDGVNLGRLGPCSSPLPQEHCRATLTARARDTLA